MKKILSVLILAVLMLSLALVGCNQVDVTKNNIQRWRGDESYVFNVSLADFNKEGTSLFNVDANGYAKDTPVASTAPYESTGYFQNLLQLQPSDAKGTYTLNVTKDDAGYYIFETSQVIYAVYKCADVGFNKSDVNASPLFTAGLVVSDPALIEEIGLNVTIDEVVLKSTTTTKLTVDALKPISSEVRVAGGYYVGKNNVVEVNDYTMRTFYDIQINDDKRTTKGKITTKLFDGEVEENETPRSEKVIDVNVKNGTLIDSLQLLPYIRNLQKGGTKFQDSPSVKVFDSANGVIRTANLYCTNGTWENKLLIGPNNSKVRLHSISAVVDGLPYLIQYNLPDLTDKRVDCTAVAGNNQEPNYTTVKFRSGFFSYELADYSVIPVADGDIISLLESLNSDNAAN